MDHPFKTKSRSDKRRRQGYKQEAKAAKYHVKKERHRLRVDEFLEEYANGGQAASY